MYGLILDKKWNGGESPITLVAKGSLQDMRNIHITNGNVIGAWSRIHLKRVESHGVTNQAGKHEEAAIWFNPDE